MDGRERYRDTAQHLHASRGPGPRPAELVEVHRRRALPVRAGGRGPVRIAPLAAVGQCPGAGGAPRPARPVRPHEQPVAALGQPGRDHQRDPQRLRTAEKPVEPVALPRLSRLAREQQPRRHPAVPRVLGRQPGEPPPRAARRIFGRLRRDDGGSREDTREGQLHDEGKYLVAQEIVNKLVQAEPQNQAAKDLLADIFEQLGYQQENVGLRNSFLAAAYELRSGIPQGEVASSSSPDVIRAMSTELFLNFLGIRMDSRKAEGLRFTINLVTPDNGEKFLIELENATLTNIQGVLADKPDLTLTINRSDLEQTMMGTKTLEEQIKDGTASVQGDASVLAKLASTMVDFDPRFEIMPGTHPDRNEVAQHNPYEAVPGLPIAE